MILHWVQKRAPVVLQFRGPNRITSDAITSISEIAAKIAVITGPKGAPGDTGPRGPQGEKGDAAVLDPESLLYLDGGNF